MEADPSALHEASHSDAAFAFGRRLGRAAVRAANGRAFHHPPRFAAEVADGLKIEDPFCLWPPEIKTRFEGDAIVSLAGYIGQEALIPRIGRVPDPVTERALTLVEEITPDADELPPRTAAERQRLDKSFDRGSSWSDEQEIAKVICTAHGPDLAHAASWLALCRAQRVAVVLGHEQQIRRLAMILAEARTLPGQAVAPGPTAAMLVLELSPSTRAFAAVAIRAFCRQLIWDGRAVPAELEELAETLTPARDGVTHRDVQSAPKARERELSAARSRRYSRRRKGADVPVRRSGAA